MNISNEVPKVNPAARYTIKETCKLLGGEKPISRNTLDSWEKSRRIKSIYRMGHRMFTGMEIIKCWNMP